MCRIIPATTSLNLLALRCALETLVNQFSQVMIVLYHPRLILVKNNRIIANERLKPCC